MVWPAYGNSPEWLPSIGKGPVAFGQVLDSHIREVGLATRGLVRGGFPTGHKDHFEKTVRYLKDNEAPIDGIGIQGHFGSTPTSPTRLLAELDRWHALGLKVLITEFDMTAPDEALQADFTRDFLTVCFSRPAVAGVLTWGFWEGSHWMPDAAFFKRDWTVTPMGSKWIDLTQNVWTIDQDVTTDANGQLNLRGYIGDDTMTVDGTKKRFRVKSDGSAEWLE